MKVKTSDNDGEDQYYTKAISYLDSLHTNFYL